VIDIAADSEACEAATCSSLGFGEQALTATTTDITLAIAAILTSFFIVYLRIKGIVVTSISGGNLIKICLA
jgi:hypothetical protein